MDYENGALKSAEFRKIRDALASIDDVNPQAVSDALAPAVPAILQVLIDRAMGSYVGERVARTGAKVEYRLDPDPKAAQIVLDRVLGKVPEELNSNQKAMNNYLTVLGGAIITTVETLNGNAPALLPDKGKPPG